MLGPGAAAAIQRSFRSNSSPLTSRWLPLRSLCRPEIKSVPELRGKTIGVNAYGGALEGMARLMLRHFGIDPDKDDQVSRHRPDSTLALARMKQGLTHATLGSPPTDFLGKKLGFVVLARAQRTYSVFPLAD